MQAEHLRWAMVQLSVPCPSCGQVHPLHAPAQTIACGCGVTVSIDDYARLGYETGPALDTLAVGAVRTRDRLKIGRQAPACASCGHATPLSAADVGRATTIYCPQCDAQSATWPAPEWLQSHLLGAQQIYASCRPGDPPPSDAPVEPVWIRCAACEAGMRIDEDSDRLTRCGACHALNHVPDPVWQALHPVRSSGAWYVLFEPLSAAERTQRAEQAEAVRAAIGQVGQALPAEQIAAHIKILQRAGGKRGLNAIGEAVLGANDAWFDAALSALSGMPGPDITRRLVEALEDTQAPDRRLALARRLGTRDAPAAVRALVELSDAPPASVAAPALGVLARIDPAAAVACAERLVKDAPLSVRRTAAEVLVQAGRTGLGPTILPLLVHPRTDVQQRAIRLLTGNARSVRAALLGLVGQDVTDAVATALIGAPEPYPRIVLELARSAQGSDRLVAVRWLQAVGLFPAMAPLYAHLGQQGGAITMRICDAITAESDAARSAALVTLLDAPTLKLRLDAATLLADAGLPGALKPLDDLASGWFTNRDLKTAAATAARAIRWRITQGAGGGLSVHDAGELSLKDEHD